MPNDDYVPKMKEELKNWRTRLDELKVKWGLAKMEMRDERRQMIDRLDKAHDALSRQWDHLAHGPAREWEKTRSAFEAARKAFRRAYEEVEEKQRISR